MINWSENIRKTDQGYFCRAAVQMANGRTESLFVVSVIQAIFK